MEAQRHRIWGGVTLRARWNFLGSCASKLCELQFELNPTPPCYHRRVVTWKKKNVVFKSGGFWESSRIRGQPEQIDVYWGTLLTSASVRVKVSVILLVGWVRKTCACKKWSCPLVEYPKAAVCRPPCSWHPTMPALRCQFGHHDDSCGPKKNILAVFEGDERF